MLPVLKAAPEALVFTPQHQVVVVDFDSAVLSHLLPLFNEGAKNGLLELAELGVDANPVLDVALRGIRHGHRFTGQQNIVFVRRGINVHKSGTP